MYKNKLFFTFRNWCYNDMIIYKTTIKCSIFFFYHTNFKLCLYSAIFFIFYTMEWAWKAWTKIWLNMLELQYGHLGAVHFIIWTGIACQFRHQCKNCEAKKEDQDLLFKMLYMYIYLYVHVKVHIISTAIWLKSSLILIVHNAKFR